MTIDKQLRELFQERCTSIDQDKEFDARIIRALPQKQQGSRNGLHLMIIFVLAASVGAIACQHGALESLIEHSQQMTLSLSNSEVPSLGNIMAILCASLISSVFGYSILRATSSD